MQNPRAKKRSPERGTDLSGPFRVNKSGNCANAGITIRCVDKGDNSRIPARCDIGATRGTTIVRLEAFDAQQVRGQSGTITAVVNALAKAGIELGENGSVIPRPKGQSLCLASWLLGESPAVPRLKGRGGAVLLLTCCPAPLWESYQIDWLFFAPAFPNERSNRTDNTHRSQSGKRVDFRHSHWIPFTGVSAYRCSHKHSNADPNSDVSPRCCAPIGAQRLQYPRVKS